MIRGISGLREATTNEPTPKNHRLHLRTRFRALEMDDRQRVRGEPRRYGEERNASDEVNWSETPMNIADEGNTDGSTRPPIEIEKANRLSSLPSPWLMFYSLTLILGGVYLFSVAFTPGTRFVAVTFIAALAAVLTGVLLWLRLRTGLIGYIFLAFGVLVFAGFRYFTDGYTTGRLGMAIGGLLMLSGFPSVAEEIPTKRP